MVNDPSGTLFGGLDHLPLTVETIHFDISLRHADVVSMVGTVVEQVPVQTFAYLADENQTGFVASVTPPFDHSTVEGAVSPVKQSVG